MSLSDKPYDDWAQRCSCLALDACPHCPYLVGSVRPLALSIVVIQDAEDLYESAVGKLQAVLSSNPGNQAAERACGLALLDWGSLTGAAPAAALEHLQVNPRRSSILAQGPCHGAVQTSRHVAWSAHNELCLRVWSIQCLSVGY